MEKGITELNLPYEVESLKKKTTKLEEKQESISEITNEIRNGIVAIKDALVSNKEQEELKNQLLMKDIEGMKVRVDKLEANQRWLVTSVIGEILAIVFGIIMIFIQKGI